MMLHYDKCHIFIVMLSVITLNVVKLSVVSPPQPPNVRTAKTLPRTNTLAYLSSASVAKKNVL
jgi:hypothetical protein